MQGIQCVFFDIGYTLINEEDVWKRRCQEQAEAEEAKRLRLSPSDIYQEIVNASLAYRPQYRIVIQKYGFAHPAPYRHELERLYPDTVPVLRSLSSKYRLGVIANQTDGLRDRLKSFGILEYFPFIVSSWDHQMMKPNPELFKIAIQQSGYQASETVMVGDRLDNDVFPAKAVGMKTIWIKQGFGGMQRPKSIDFLPDAEIHCLNDLLNVLYDWEA